MIALTLEEAEAHVFGVARCIGPELVAVFANSPIFHAIRRAPCGRPAAPCPATN
ncbi:hypothetical protein LXH13_00265 [Streptomyces spinosirectus]|jgi:hypothetical protein|uniref:hypothetical protein n=1 Tax=Streptomyces TaxID=1883 RepID=UPI0015E63115|nr:MULTISPECIES: hypothetical protein [Streptomyces]MBY8344047.1 hypothetical protein [Streptomyces plumbidurans]UIR15553.1 hypothetical protein LXH13_00265 [Streptomyces spinosirectus]